MKILVVLASLASLAAAPALADPGHGNGHDKDKGRGGYDGPPGLANKPYGMPPGQAKKMWRKGQRMPTSYYTRQEYYVVEPARYHLRYPPPGYRWVMVDGDAYLVRTQSGLIADVIVNLLR
jgi:Ni/Co efflux regulator RcnB